MLCAALLSCECCALGSTVFGVGAINGPLWPQPLSISASTLAAMDVVMVVKAALVIYLYSVAPPLLLIKRQSIRAGASVNNTTAARE